MCQELQIFAFVRMYVLGWKLSLFRLCDIIIIIIIIIIITIILSLLLSNTSYRGMEGLEIS